MVDYTPRSRREVIYGFMLSFLSLCCASTRPIGVFIRVFGLAERRLRTAVLVGRRIGEDVGLAREIWEFKVLNETIIIYHEVILLGALMKPSSSLRLSLKSRFKFSN